MSWRARVLAVGLALGLTAGVAQGIDFCDSPVIKAWEAERDAAARRVLREWLGRAEPSRLREAGFELLRIEVLLTPCIPPLQVEDFYLARLSRPEPELIPVAVLQAFLRRYGLALEPRDFFAGRTFWLQQVR